MIVAPQLSSGWWHNYSTKTRQEGRANEQSMYSLMSMNKTAITLLPKEARQVQQQLSLLLAVWDF